MSKKIIICLDGTANDPEDALAVDQDCSITNVLKLHLLVGGSLDNTAENLRQRSLYYSGVGTEGLSLKKIKQQALALSDPEIIRERAYQDLCKIYEEDDQIFIFGFSRGAAIARQLTKVIEEKGIGQNSNPRVRFLGVWDTVASIGVPNLNPDLLPSSKEIFEKNNTISNIVDECYHLVALDETRLAYRPILINNEQKVKEIWFPGVHSDIGGGYRNDGLSDITLEFLLEKLNKLKVNILSLDEIKRKSLEKEGTKLIRIEDLKIKPNLSGEIHLHQRGLIATKKTLRPRKVVVLEDGVISNIDPIIHHSVIDKAIMDKDYCPRNIFKHRVLQASGKFTAHGSWAEHFSE